MSPKTDWTTAWETVSRNVTLTLTWAKGIRELNWENESQNEFKKLQRSIRTIMERVLVISKMGRAAIEL
jgi:ribonuclease PH